MRNSGKLNNDFKIFFGSGFELVPDNRRTTYFMVAEYIDEIPNF
jgi:hypothetical protein